MGLWLLPCYTLCPHQLDWTAGRRLHGALPEESRGCMWSSTVHRCSTGEVVDFAPRKYAGLRYSEIRHFLAEMSCIAPYHNSNICTVLDHHTGFCHLTIHTQSPMYRESVEFLRDWCWLQQC